MCGIAGGVNVQIDSQRLKSDLGHRGPDAFGSYIDNRVELYHTRLAIQDIVGGSQPMERNGCVIVFNGEIYNHLRLRKRYLSDYSFQSRSDTETLLALYIKHEEKMFEDIDGMFAFAIYDRRKERLFFAVDRAGKKPLYLYREKNRLFFASELVALRAQIDPAINEDAIYAYLRLGFFPRTVSAYQGVERLEGGSWLAINLRDFSESRGRYFDIESLYKSSKKKLSFDMALEHLDRVLERSVKERMLSSEREVGAFLSGGIDSSLIVAKASAYTKKLKTFTVAFEGAYDESNLAKLTAQRYDTEHRTIHISMNLKEDVEKILRLYGQPFMDSSAVPSWYVSRAAKEYVTVILNGDGADELFGGYRRYVPLANDWLRFAKPFSALLHLLPPPSNKISKYNYLYRLLAMAKKEGIDFYISATSDIFEDIYHFKEKNIYLEQVDRMVRSCPLSNLEKMLCLDFKLILFSDLLVKMDIATMAHSLEARSPFLSKWMLELASQIAKEEKIKGVKTKYILRELARRYLPSPLISQPKRGFEVPLRQWIEHDLKEPLYDRLAHGAYSESYIERSFIDRLLDNDPTIPPEKRAKMLWALYSLEVWRASK